MSDISNSHLHKLKLLFVTLAVTVLATSTAGGDSDVHFVVLQDELKPFVAKEQLSLLLGGAENVIYTSALNSLFPALNKLISSYRSDFRIPTVTVPVNSTTKNAGRCAREIGLGHSAEGQMKVVALAASHFQWNRVLLHTDEGRSFKMLRLLGQKTGFTVLSSVSLSDEEAMDISVDVVVVHCDTRTCYLRFIEMLKLWQEKESVRNFAWIVTEDTAWEIESKPTFWKDIAVAFNAVDRKVLECDQFSYCPSANKRAQANLMSVYDAILLLESTVDKQFQSFADQKFDSIFGPSEPLVYESSGKARVFSSYNIFRLSGSGKVAHVSGNDLMVSAPLLKEELGHSPQKRRRRAFATFPEKCPSISHPYHFNVTSVEERPFLFVNDTGLYDGLVVDLMKELQKRMEFTYTIIPARDNKYGKIINNENGTVTATGMMAQLLECEADLAVGTLFVTSEREKYISFADTCWMDASLTLYGYEKRVKELDIWAFSRPFSWQLWITLLGTFFGFVLFFCLCRLTTGEWNLKNDRHFLKLYLRNAWNLLTRKEANSDTDSNKKPPKNGKELKDRAERLMCTCGKEIAVDNERKSRTWKNEVTSRILIGGWLFFTTIATSMYTANLASIFVAETIAIGIQSIDELADQTNVQYGTVEDSAAERFFHTSSIDKYSKMGDYMKKTKGVMVTSAEEGYERVRNSSGEYVFIWDDLSLEYAVSTSPDCNTRLIGREFDKRGYGIGMRQGQAYRRNFTLALLQLKDDGSVENLRDRWITKAGVCQLNNVKVDEVGKPQPLELKAFGGAFIVLAGAGILATAAFYFCCCCEEEEEEEENAYSF